MGMEELVKQFHDSHKDITGPDAGNKIAQDVAEATKNMTPDQKHRFYIGLDHSDSVYEKVNYSFKDTDNSGIRDTLFVQTEEDAHPWIPGNQVKFTETNVNAKIRELKTHESTSRGSILEQAVSGTKEKMDAVNGTGDYAMPTPKKK